MTDPLNLLLGGQEAIVVAAAPALAAEFGPLRHTFLQGQQPPYNVIGDINSESRGDVDEQLELITADIESVYRGKDRSQLLRQMHAVRVAVDGRRLTLDGATFRVAWRGGGATGAAGEGTDGFWFAGINRFELTAEPA